MKQITLDGQLKRTYEVQKTDRGDKIGVYIYECALPDQRNKLYYVCHETHSTGGFLSREKILAVHSESVFMNEYDARRHAEQLCDSLRKKSRK